MRSALFLICSIALGGGGAETVHAAGFDCSNATTDVETIVCDDQQLGELDYVLNKVFTSRLKSLPQGKKDSLLKNQRAWAKTRNECVGMLPGEQYACLLDTYRTRIRKLGGTGSLIGLYDKACQTDLWKCEYAGDLELSIGQPSEAIKYYTIMCDRDYDGDAGGNCFKKASVLEKTGRVSEAFELYSKTCSDRKNNEACAAALRLDTKKSTSDSWSGLYRNKSGTLFLQMTTDGQFTVKMVTTWANGHQCEYDGHGRIEGARASFEPDSGEECNPELTRSGKVLSIRDPNDQCRMYSCGARGVFEGDFKKE
jgi:uncharacterized protein